MIPDNYVAVLITGKLGGVSSWHREEYSAQTIRAVIAKLSQTPEWQTACKVEMVVESLNDLYKQNEQKKRSQSFVPGKKWGFGFN
jgi:hypothetical protein